MHGFGPAQSHDGLSLGHGSGGLEPGVHFPRGLTKRSIPALPHVWGLKKPTMSQAGGALSHLKGCA
jgi:hypothetical protein